MIFSHCKKILAQPTPVFSTYKVSRLIASALLVLTTSFGAQANTSNTCDLEADRCSGKPLSPLQSDKTLFLADTINAQLEEMYEKYKAEGKDLSVVVIAREGSNLKKFKILQDDGGKKSLQQLVQEVQAETQSNNANNNAHQPTGSMDYSILQGKINKEDRLKYSHLGIAFRNLSLQKERIDQNGQKVRDTITGPGTGKWAFYHLLYSCDKPEYLKEEGQYIKRSHIFKGTVHSFFWDHLSGYNAQVIVPEFQIQSRLEDLLVKQMRVNLFKENQYNAASKFNDLKQQNSNQFVLEALAAALASHREVNSRKDAIEVLSETGYSASKLLPTGLMSVIGLPFVQNIVSSMMPTMCFKSQPELKRYGIGEIITSNSVVNWMKRNNMVHDILEMGIEKDSLNEIEEYHKSKEPESARPQTGQSPR